MSVFYTRHDGGVTLMKDGKQSAVANDHPNFEKILAALRAKNYTEVDTLMSIKNTINAKGANTKLKGRSIFVKDDAVFYTDRNKKVRELHGSLVDRILEDLGKPSGEKFATALLLFLDNIMKNTVKDIREELYDFLMSGKAPITYDGCFLAYKKVRNDYKDIFSGKFDNSPGEVVRMKQADVDTDRTRTCSHGLHFATLGYLSHYGGSSNSPRVVVVKVNPRHVFAIPTDYQNQKGRASEYFVVGEYTSKNNQSVDAFKDAFIDEDSKIGSAPDVKFVGSLRPSLEQTARSYGLVDRNGRVKVVNGTENDYIAVIVTGDKVADISGTEYDVTADEIKTLSITTKSVIAALKKAVATAQKGPAKKGTAKKN